MSEQWAAAFLTGMLATVNPCGFAMLPGFLAFYLGTNTDAHRQPLASGLFVGLALSTGFATVFVTFGLLLAVGLSVIINAIPWIAVTIGGALLLLGTVQLFGATPLTGRTSRLGSLGDVATRIAQRRSGPQAMVAYGAAYAVAALSCSLALLLSVVAQATATGSVWALLSVFAAYAIGSSVVLILLAVTAALSRETLLRRVQQLMGAATRIGGAALALAGLYLLTYWVPALTGNTPGGPVGEAVTSLSAQVSAVVSDNAYVMAALVVLVITAVVVLAARPRSDRPSTPTAPLRRTK